MKVTRSPADIDRREERRRRELVRSLLVAARAKGEAAKRPDSLLARQRPAR